jgi:hypothetical protein
MRVGVLPMFAANSDKARIDFLSNSMIIMYGWFFGPLSLMLYCEIWWFGIVSRKKKIIAGLVSIVTLLMYLVLVTRLDLFRFFIFAIILFHYGIGNIDLKKAVLIFVGGVSLFMLAVFSRFEQAGIETFMTYMKLDIPVKYAWFSNIYAYVVNNFWNMDYAFTKFVDGTEYYPLSWGFELIRPIIFVTNLTRDFVLAYGFDTIYNDQVTKVSGLNTIIYVWHFYKDFGAFGVFFLTSLFGLLCSVFYVNTLLKPTLLRIAIFSIFVGFIFFSFFVPLWNFWFVYLNIFVYIIAHQYTEKAKILTYYPE